MFWIVRRMRSLPVGVAAYATWGSNESLQRGRHSVVGLPRLRSHRALPRHKQKDMKRQFTQKACQSFSCNRIEQKISFASR